MDPNKVKMELINVIIAIVVFLIPTTFTLTIPNTLEQSSNGKIASKEMPFVEYFMEHNVSQSDAKKSFLDVGVKLLKGMVIFNSVQLCSWFKIIQRSYKFVIFPKCFIQTDKPKHAWCMKCTSDIIRYCFQGSMLDDHCCCDRNHESGKFLILLRKFDNGVFGIRCIGLDVLFKNAFDGI